MNTHETVSAPAQMNTHETPSSSAAPEAAAKTPERTRSEHRALGSQALRAAAQPEAPAPRETSELPQSPEAWQPPKYPVAFLSESAIDARFLRRGPEADRQLAGQEIAKHRRYVSHNRGRFELNNLESSTSDRTTRIAKDFERAVIFGVGESAWLGNQARPDGSQPFFVEATGAADYDDQKHRVDGIFQILLLPRKAQKPAETPETAPENPQSPEAARPEKPLPELSFCFDVTVSGNRETILNKLTRQYNDNARLPFGCTHLEYYRHLAQNRKTGEFVDRVEMDSFRRAKGAKPLPAMEMLPRYVIGIDKEWIDSRMSGRQGEKRISPQASGDVRYMFLSQIHAQNELYLAMLPDDTSEQPLPPADRAKAKRARATFEAIDALITPALDEAALALAAAPWMGKQKSAEFAALRARGASPQALRQFVDFEFTRHLEEQTESNLPGHTDCYLQIMECTRDLTYAVEDLADEDEATRRSSPLWALRSVSAHNRPVTDF